MISSHSGTLSATTCTAISSLKVSTKVKCFRSYSISICVQWTKININKRNNDMRGKIVLSMTGFVLTISSMFSALPAKAEYGIGFINSCTRDPVDALRVAVRFYSSGKWIDKRWYSVDSGKRIRLNGVLSDHDFFYYYAEEPKRPEFPSWQLGGKLRWSGDDAIMDNGLGILGLRKVNVPGEKSGTYYVPLTCPDPLVD